MTDLITTVNRTLTAKEFQSLADVPPEVEWFANLGNVESGRAYENALKDFMNFTDFTNVPAKTSKEIFLFENQASGTDLTGGSYTKMELVGDGL